MKIRHNYAKNCEIITGYGTVKLDGNGYVTNLEAITTPGNLIKENQFVDGDLFPPRGMDKAPDVGGKKEEPRAKSKEAVTEEQYWEAMKPLLEDPRNLNGNGALNIDVLLKTLRSLGYPVINGARRDEITAKFTAKG
jgi:hypothetical protein